ncbi:MAG: 1-deoxy-D-xylulose-5-phosphate reductoisomerase [Ancrocorticia sp.]
MRECAPRERDVIILGSTGSIGTQALDVISRHRDSYRVLGLGAGGAQLELLADQAISFNVPVLAVADPDAAVPLAALLAERAPGQVFQILSGPQAMSELAGGWSSLATSTYSSDSVVEPLRGQATSSSSLVSASAHSSDSVVVLNGITGSVGLTPTLAALRSGATLALANKESLVVGGGLIKEAMTRPGQIVPVDSEHSAIAQALRSGIHHRGLTSENLDRASEVRRIILTASGGPFRGKKRADLAGVTAAQALNHPTWDMGPVVTINSSTLMNKGLELIEAAYLFEMDPRDIVPVVHPQSIIHSMVEFSDGATIAQASPPDMRLPIALGLSWPERLDNITAPNVWDAPVAWHFEPLDHETFPAVRLAREAVASSSLHPAVLNAVNEECVAAFLAGELPYLAITDVVESVLGEFTAPGGTLDVETVLGTEKWARARAHEVMSARLR